MREGQEKEGRKHGKIKGRGTPSGPNLRFCLSAHGVGVPLCGTVDFQPAVRRFSGNGPYSASPDGTVRQTTVICGVGHVV
ncbi:hypothetical protein AD953_15430 [Acetobacter malorum]|uniref:Uncharacterized protein n=1 Tax=Acetobacter malorum TaxID=178901 RepID=A0A149V0E2_9PROT|nr:hypothetical protein [Acetobacter malorum]KXV73644.1 hypothetical protein AD953_15430 [Acetobacter malorum]